MDNPKTNPEALEPFERSKLVTLIPLHKYDAAREDKEGRTVKLGKSPRHKNWTDRPPDEYTYDNAVTNMSNGCNVGVRMDGVRNGQRMLVIDCDPRNYEIDPLTEEPINSAEAFFDAVGLNIDDYPVVVTGSGGLHVYVTIPANFEHVESIEGYPGVEFKSGKGRQVVAPGSIHPDTGELYAWRKGGVSIYLLGSGVGEYGFAPEHMLHLIERPKSSCIGVRGDHELNEEADLEALSEALGEAIGYIGYYPDWVAFGHAIKRTLGEYGYPAFCAVSNASDVHKWEELSETAHGYGIPKILSLAESYRPGSSETVSAILDQMLEKKPRESEQQSAEDDFAGLFDDSDKSGPDERQRRNVIGDTKSISDLKDWVYVVTEERFIHRKDGRRYTQKQFDSAFKHVADKTNASTLVFSNKTGVKKFDRAAFRPGKPQDLGEVFNTWRPSPIVPKEGDTSVIERHFELLIPDETERSYVLDWLYYAICEPGIKINFALVIVGEQGNGKSVIGKLAKTCIGERFCEEVPSESMNRQFNDFLKDKQLIIIEELMMTGRLDFANRMKPLITQSTFQSEAKYGQLLPAENHFNVLAFTNHDDAIKLEGGDRRYLVIKSPLSIVQEDGYYEALHRFAECEESAAAFKYMLHERKKQGHVKLKPYGKAPDTLAKADMLEASRSDEYKDIKRAIDEGSLVGDLHTWEDLKACLSSRTNRNTTDNKVRAALDELGIRKHGRWFPHKGEDGGLETCALYSTAFHEHYGDMPAQKRALAYSDKLELDPLDL